MLAIAPPESLVFSPTPAAVGGAEPTCVPAPTAAGVGGVNASGPRSKSAAAGTLKHGGTGRLRVWAVGPETECCGDPPRLELPAIAPPGSVVRLARNSQGFQAEPTYV